MASEEHLAETKLLSVKKHLKLICMQFLTSAFHIDRPSHSVIKRPTGERKGRKEEIHMLQLRFGYAIDHFLKDGVLPEADYKKTINSSHTSVVAAEESLLVNKLLGTLPPDISPEEVTLGCCARTTLTQLRSTHCNDLNSYKARIGSSPNDLCPEWGVASHTVEQIFHCPSNPTNFTKHDL
jgi:hypothetical protein